MFVVTLLPPLRLSNMGWLAKHELAAAVVGPPHLEEMLYCIIDPFLVEKSLDLSGIIAQASM